MLTTYALATISTLTAHVPQCVCMHECTYECMILCIHFYIYACMHVYLYASMHYICINDCMHVLSVNLCFSASSSAQHFYVVGGGTCCCCSWLRRVFSLSTASNTWLVAAYGQSHHISLQWSSWASSSSRRGLLPLSWGSLLVVLAAVLVSILNVVQRQRISFKKEEYCLLRC